VSSKLDAFQRGIVNARLGHNPSLEVVDYVSLFFQLLKQLPH